MHHASTDEEYEARRRIVAAGLSFFQRGLAGGASGNMSCGLSDGRLLVTPTGVSLGALTPETLSLLDKSGALLSGPPPTKEVPLHLACYAARPDCGGVVHLHAPYATALSCCAAVPAYTPYGLMRYGRVGRVPYSRPGGTALGEAVSRCMRHRAAALMANHGLLMTGSDITAAAHNADELEESCRLFFILQGQQPRLLSPEEQRELLRP